MVLILPYWYDDDRDRIRDHELTANIDRLYRQIRSEKTDQDEREHLTERRNALMEDRRNLRTRGHPMPKYTKPKNQRFH